MSHAPTVLKPVPKQATPARQPVQPTAKVQVLRANRPSTQLSFQFHRLP
ncbi:MAG TPA: hypothetical protein VMT14_04285 [Burkholderiaceae bacterium]|jgi:hypothetical protein|nr:hypothetical protein [Burkholderiaceae bacterium]